jgi:hypothetical protein
MTRIEVVLRGAFAFGMMAQKLTDQNKCGDLSKFDFQESQFIKFMEEHKESVSKLHFIQNFYPTEAEKENLKQFGFEMKNFEINIIDGRLHLIVYSKKESLEKIFSIENALFLADSIIEICNKNEK